MPAPIPGDERGPGLLRGLEGSRGVRRDHGPPARLLRRRRRGPLQRSGDAVHGGRPRAEAGEGCRARGGPVCRERRGRRRSERLRSEGGSGLQPRSHPPPGGSDRRARAGVRRRTLHAVLLSGHRTSLARAEGAQGVHSAGAARLGSPGDLLGGPPGRIQPGTVRSGGRGHPSVRLLGRIALGRGLPHPGDAVFLADVRSARARARPDDPLLRRQPRSARVGRRGRGRRDQCGLAPSHRHRLGPNRTPPSHSREPRPGCPPRRRGGRGEEDP